MIQLLEEIGGWLGYLQRVPVLVQLVGLALLLTFYRLTELRRKRAGARLPQRRLPQPRLLLLSGITLLALCLAALGQPYGIVLVMLGLVAGWFALALLRQTLARFIEPQQLRQLDTGLLRPLYLLFAGLTVIRQLDNPMDLALIPLGKWFGAEVNIGQALGSAVLVYLLATGSGPPSQGVALLVQRFIGISEGTRRALGLVIRYVVVGLGIVAILNRIGFDRTATLTVAGGLSVGLGFGVKEVFSNFISGLWLLFEGSVRPGDVLFIDGDPCEVRSLGLRAAVLWRDRDNAELVIPNQTFFTATTTTYTGSDRLRRSQVLVGAAYRHDPAEVIALLEATARTNPRVLATPAPKALLLSYGDSAVNYALRFWIADPMDNVSICSEVQSGVWQAFRDGGIEIPFPQQVVHRQSEAS
jgi:small-conductance mechanosensitive channel